MKSRDVPDLMLRALRHVAALIFMAGVLAGCAVCGAIYLSVT